MASPPANPQRRQARQTRALETVRVILDAAAKILVTEGYHACTTQRIAKAAGVSVGSIYQYFGNRDQVFEALIEREVATLDQSFALQQAAGANLSLEDALRAMLQAGVQGWSYGPVLYRQLEFAASQVLRSHVDQAKARLHAHTRQLLELHRDELRVSDLDLATFVVINATVGLSTNASQELFEHQYVDVALELILCYLVGV